VKAKVSASWFSGIGGTWGENGNANASNGKAGNGNGEIKAAAAAGKVVAAAKGGAAGKVAAPGKAKKSPSKMSMDSEDEAIKKNPFALLNFFKK
jgi:hypothetical protein